ncbi:MAG: hypothetical protein ACJ77K_16830 [Bacteroidia bacterium]
MIHKNPDIDLRPIIDELRQFDVSEEPEFRLFLDKAAEQIREAGDAVSDGRLQGNISDKVVVDKLDVVRSQIRELRLLLNKMDHSGDISDRLTNALDGLEEELKREK